MDIQQLLADAQAKADTNGDGKLTTDDIQELATQHGLDGKMVEDLKARADGNGDGKLDFTDIQSMAGGLGTMLNDVKGKFFK